MVESGQTKTDNSNRDEIFFQRPEVAVLFKSIFGNIEHESDRGAVLIAQEIIDNELTELVRATVPDGMTMGKINSLLKYPGFLSSFSAKADVVYIAGLITKNLYDAIHTLRKIRNSAAHGSQSFSLEPHRTKLVEVYRKLGDFGETPVEDVLRYFAIKLYIDPLADSLLAKCKVGEIEGIDPVFKDRKEIIQHIGTDPETLKIVKNKLAKIELGVAVLMLGGLIISSRDNILRSRSSETEE